MATQEILVKYKADVSDLTNQLKQVIERMDKLEAESKSSAKGVDVLTKSVDNLGKEFTEVPKEIPKATAAVKTFTKTATDETNKLRSAVSTIGKDIAAGITAGFSILAVQQFAKASLSAFAEAESAAHKLEFAVTQIAGESQQVFERLLEQAKQLQEISIFSDESIIQAQTALATFGLASDQIDELLPRILDFASATKTDLATSTDVFLRALEGQTRGLVTAGLKFKDTGTQIGNYNELLKSTEKLTGATAAATETLSGQIEQTKNQVDELQESLGGALVAYFRTFVDTIKPAVDAIIQNIRELFAVFRSGKSAAEDASTGLEILRTTIQVITIPLRFLLTVVGLVTDGIVLLARTAKATAVALVTAFNGIGKTITDVGTGIAGVFSGIRNFDGTEITNALAGIKNPVKNLATDISNAFNEAFKLDLSEKVESETENAKKAAERILTAQELQKLQLEDLIDLQLKYADATSITGKSNLELINLELAARKKAATETKKLQDEAAEEEKARREKAFEDFKTQLEKEQDELLKVIERAEQRAKDQDALLEFRVRFVTNLEGEEAAFQFARDELFKTFQEESIQADVTSDTVEEANAKKQKAYEDYIAALEKLVGGFAIFEEKEVEQTQETVVADWINANEEILNASAQLVSDLTALFSTLTENQLIDLRKTTDAKLEALDIEQKAINDQLNKRRISETEAERKTEELLKKREATEAQAAKKERELKKKQFNLDKANALIQITINTAQAVSRAYADAGPIAGIPLAALMAAAGIAQAAVVASQANPYKKGTKSAKKGLALVDEEGTEAILRGKGRLTTLERGDKVLTAPKTKTYGEVLDAMMDNRFEKYVMQKYVAPQLEKQRKISQTKDKQDFAENITKSMVINNMSDGESGFHLKKIRQGGLSVRLPKDQLDYIAQQSKSDPYR